MQLKEKLRPPERLSLTAGLNTTKSLQSKLTFVSRIAQERIP